MRVFWSSFQVIASKTPKYIFLRAFRDFWQFFLKIPRNLPSYFIKPSQSYLFCYILPRLQQGRFYVASKSCFPLFKYYVVPGMHLLPSLSRYVKVYTCLPYFYRCLAIPAFISLAGCIYVSHVVKSQKNFVTLCNILQIWRKFLYPGRAIRFLYFIFLLFYKFPIVVSLQTFCVFEID